MGKRSRSRSRERRHRTSKHRKHNALESRLENLEKRLNKVLQPLDLNLTTRGSFTPVQQSSDTTNLVFTPPTVPETFSVSACPLAQTGSTMLVGGGKHNEKCDTPASTLQPPAPQNLHSVPTANSATSVVCSTSQGRTRQHQLGQTPMFMASSVKHIPRKPS
ncbi:uncharacterized protein LOC119190071 isoform X1 [Manduca sexta]|uniref:uncharacterized protein LOC119190071 isoform X1 n=1 Tax=Manduca sexta TaxID=7130 RepID=UPI00188EC004|nr:uncharacterized protein LOC119190071 isoform X1 [Manduca sexta]